MVAPGLPYHITQRGTNRERVFFTVADRLLYLQLVRENLAETGVSVLAYCLMTNHVHFVVVPQRADSLASLFARVNGRYAQAVNIRKGRTGHLWQCRFHSCLVGGSHLWRVLRYVEDNPCRAGLVERPEGYRWSSAAAHLRGVEDVSRVLDMGFWAGAGGVSTWAELHGKPALGMELVALRKCTHAGRPFGDEAFVTAMEERFQRKWRRTAGDLVGEIAMSA